MAGNTPRRHGLNWSRHPGGPIPTGAAKQATGTPSRTGKRPDQPRVLPVDQVHAWLNQLPSDAVQQMALSYEVRWDNTIGANGTVSVIPANTTVSQGQVWIFTDIEYYAITPTVGLQAPPTRINAAAFVGLVNFAVKFSDKVPIKDDGARMSPYISPSQTASTVSGWPWVNTVFGPSRMPSFAVYARGNESLKVDLTIQNPPRFPISKVGVNMNGFNLSETIFDSLWA